jgi:two-component system, chemotaxis family, protein-glutamate methylesterase/glutaminase
MAATAPQRVVVADDSGFMRRLLSSALEKSGFDVVGVACDGDEALAMCDRHHPDAMTLDLAMPGMDGIGVLRALRQDGAPPTPVVVVSAFSPAHGSRAVDALSEGAFDLVAKPAAGESITTFVSELKEKVEAAAQSPRFPRRPPATRAPARGGVRRPRPASSRTKRLVVIASSTGGPKALGLLIPRLPSPLGAGVVIVQHMPPGFTGSLAARLDREAKLTVAEARGGEAIEPGRALLAPGGNHLRLGSDRVVRLTSDAPIGGLRPRADVTIADAAKLWGDRMLLVVLTGMGKDGLEGAEAVRAHGGRILAEAESTCTVYGMPRAVAEADLADAVLPLDELPAAIAEEAGA